MPALTLEWTLPLIARRPGDFGNKPTGFVSEFDCELTINWWADDVDQFGYELDYVAIDDGKKDRFIITKATDAMLWPLLERGFEYERRRTQYLHDQIMERIHEALSRQVDDGIRLPRACDVVAYVGLVEYIE